MNDRFFFGGASASGALDSVSNVSRDGDVSGRVVVAMFRCSGKRRRCYGRLDRAESAGQCNTCGLITVQRIGNGGPCRILVLFGENDVGVSGDAGLEALAGLVDLVGREPAPLMGGVDLLTLGREVEIGLSHFDGNALAQVAPPNLDFACGGFLFLDPSLATQTIEDRKGHLEAHRVDGQESNT